MYMCVYMHTHMCLDNSYLKLKLMQITMVSFTFYCELDHYEKYRYYCQCGWTCAINGAAKGISSNNTKRME